MESGQGHGNMSGMSLTIQTLDIVDINVSKISPAVLTPDPDTALVSPNVDPTSTDIRCGRNASVLWSEIKTATVRAGHPIGFAAGEPMLPVFLPVKRMTLITRHIARTY